MGARKVWSRVLAVVGTILTLGGLVLTYFGKTRMGMARFLTFRTSQLKKAVPLDAILVVLVVAAVVWLVVMVVRRRRTVAVGWMVAAVVVALVALWALVFTTYPAIRAHYALTLLAGLGALSMDGALTVAPSRSLAASTGEDGKAGGDTGSEADGETR